MATQEQINTVLQHMVHSHPVDFFRAMSETQVGIGAVLRFLRVSVGPVTAGAISDHLQVSTARTAVLLKKMEAKDLIVRLPCPGDARAAAITLSPHGLEHVLCIERRLTEQLGAVIDRVGFDRIMEFTKISEEIRLAVCPPHPEF